MGENFYEELIEIIFLQTEEELDTQFPHLSKEEIIQSLIDFFDPNVICKSEENDINTILSDKVIKFELIDFTGTRSQPILNYLHIINKLKKVHFNKCYFEINQLPIEEIECSFNYCCFDNECFIFEGCQNLILDSNQIPIVFKNCHFHNRLIINQKHEYENMIIDCNLFSNCNIGFIDASKVEFKGYIFYDYNDYEKTTISEVKLVHCTVEKNFILHNSNRDVEKEFLKIKKLDLSFTIFTENVKVKIQFCEIDEGVFYNTKFKDLADFYQTKFHKVNFKRADFEKVSVFSQAEFNCNVDFSYVKFFGKAIFRDTIVNQEYSLNLRNAIFDNEANFLDITSKSRYNKKLDKFIGEPIDIKVANRETARIIKNFYDNSNNIIEANRFYKLEMEERKKEFDNIKDKNDNHLFEFIVFLFHKYSSNHSQNWALSFFWIIFFTLGYSLYDSKNLTIEFLKGFKEKSEIGIIYDFFKLLDNPFFIAYLFILIAITSLFCLSKRIPHHKSGYLVIFTSVSLFLYVFISHDYNLLLFAKNLNPFSIMTGKDELTFGLFVYKIVIAYLIYQLIISVRQNTRRN